MQWSALWKCLIHFMEISIPLIIHVAVVLLLFEHLWSQSVRPTEWNIENTLVTWSHPYVESLQLLHLWILQTPDSSWFHQATHIIHYTVTQLHDQFKWISSFQSTPKSHFRLLWSSISATKAILFQSINFFFLFWKDLIHLFIYLF